MRIANRLAGALAGLACAWVPAFPAEENPVACRYGFTLQAALPRQDLRDINGRTGYGFGVFAENAGPGFILQTRLDYLRYAQTNQPLAKAVAEYTVPAARTLSANALSLAVEARHALPVPGLERFHALLGVLAIRYEFDTSGLDPLTDQNGLPVGGIRRYKDKTPVKLGLALGLGFDLSRGMTLTERYTAVDINGATLAAWETGLGFRF